MKKITIIGAGNVGYHLANAFHQNGFEIVNVFSRKIENALSVANNVNALAIDNLDYIDRDIDLLIIAVPDDYIPSVVEQIPHKDIPIAHTSGTVSSQVLIDAGFPISGIFYPLQTLKKDTPADYSNLPLLTYSKSKKFDDSLFSIATKISRLVSRVPDEQRAKLHVAAAIVNNLTNHLYGIAYQYCERERLPYDMLRPLAEKTVENAFLGNPKDYQTGPAVRNDFGTIKKHLEALESYDWESIYFLLSEKIVKQHSKS